MNINLEIKGAEALMARFNPGGVPSDWEARAGMAYRQRASVVINAVEADIRADERARIAAWLYDQYYEGDPDARIDPVWAGRRVEENDLS